MAGQTFGGKASSFDYRTITSVEVRTGVLRGVFEIATGGVQGVERSAWTAKDGGAIKAPNCIPLERAHYAKFQEAANLIRDRLGGGPVAAPASVAVRDRYEQLQRIAQLRDQGILSEQEFEVEKARILST